MGFLNINGWPKDPFDPKNKQLQSLINDHDFDAFAMTEMNRYWPALPMQDRLYERTFKWWQSLHISQAFNKDFKPLSDFLPGCTAVFSRNHAASRAMKSGQDPSGLGRWTWTRYWGHEGITLRVVSAYCPVINKSGPMSVYNQHKTYLDNHDDNRDPRIAFTADLRKEILVWQLASDQILIGMDANEDVHDGSLYQTMAALNLREAVTSRHGLTGPRTYQGGSKPIDALWVSPTLMGLQCGYLKFVPWFDHCCLWIDIPTAVAFGHDLPPIVSARA